MAEIKFTPANEPEVDKPASPTPEVENEPEQYIAIRAFSVPVGPQLITFESGSIIDDPFLIKQIKDAFTNTVPPMRPVSTEMLLQAGKL